MFPGLPCVNKVQLQLRSIIGSAEIIKFWQSDFPVLWHVIVLVTIAPCYVFSTEKENVLLYYCNSY